MALRYHPDKNPNVDTTKEFQAVVEANNVLGNAESREKYDNAQQPRSKLKSTPADLGSTSSAAQKGSPAEDALTTASSASHHGSGSAAPQGPQISQSNLFQPWMPPNIRGEYALFVQQQAQWQRYMLATPSNTMNQPSISTYNIQAIYQNMHTHFSVQAQSPTVGQQLDRLPSTPATGNIRSFRHPMRTVVGLNWSIPCKNIGHVPTTADRAVGHAFPHPITWLDMARRQVPLPPVWTPTPRSSGAWPLHFQWKSTTPRPGTSSNAARQDEDPAPRDY
jgi:hypothetical protein